MDPAKETFVIPQSAIITKDKEDESEAVSQVVAQVAAIAQYNLDKMNNSPVAVVKQVETTSATPQKTEQAHSRDQLKKAYEKFVNGALATGVTNAQTLAEDTKKYAALVDSRRAKISRLDSSIYEDVDRARDNTDKEAEERKAQEEKAVDEAEEVCSKFSQYENIDISPYAAVALQQRLTDIANSVHGMDWKELAKRAGLSDKFIDKIEAAIKSDSIYGVFALIGVA